jgi:putative transposase
MPSRTKAAGFFCRRARCHSSGSGCGRTIKAGIVADYGRKHDNAVACFTDDLEACIAHLRFPVTHRRAIRTTNLLERLFVEERRRLKIIPNAFGERAVLKLMFGALTRAAERWKSIKFSEFERRQLSAVEKELDQEYEAQVDLSRKSSKGAAQTKISSSTQT